MPYHRKRTFECKMIFRASFVPLVLDISAKPKTIPKQMQKGMVIFMDETDRTAPANAPCWLFYAILVFFFLFLC